MKHPLKALLSFIKTSPRDTIIILTFIIAIAVLFNLYWKTQIDDNWDQFIIEHHCQKILKEGSNNRRAGWACDDGETYYRWRQQA